MIAVTPADAPVKQTGRRWTIARWTIFAASALTAIFVVPQFVPVTPSISPSYIFGYSNHTGVLLLLGFLVLAGVFSSGLQVEFQRAASPTRIPKQILWIWMAVFAVAGTAMCFLVRGLHGFEESAYLIDRIKMLAMGERPFKDFEFAYGVLFLYCPRAMMALNLTAVQSYFVFWLLCLLAGVWLLYQTLNMLDYPTQRTVEIFHLFCLFSLTAVVCTGVNYTFLRFLPAPYFALLIQRIDRRKGSHNRTLAMLASVVFTAVLLVISPEIALAYSVGSACYFLFFGRRDKRSIAEYFSLLILDAALLLTWGRLGAFATLKAFGSGGFNLPIVPGPHILSFLFVCGLVSFFVASRLRGGSRGDGTLMVVAVSAGTLFAALGRCDIGHVGFAAIGILLVGTILASNFPRLWDMYRIAFIVLFVFIPAVLTLALFPLALAERKAPVDPNQIKPCLVLYAASGPTLAPFGYSLNCEPQVRSGAIDPGYFYGLDNVLTPGSVDRKISEMRDHPGQNLLLPNNFDPQCTFDLTVQRSLIRILLLYPYSGRVKNEHSVAEPLCAYIHSHYTASESTRAKNHGFSIWNPVTTATTDSIQ
jgi:hypothetical protein